MLVLYIFSIKMIIATEFNVWRNLGVLIFHYWKLKIK